MKKIIFADENPIIGMIKTILLLWVLFFGMDLWHMGLHEEISGIWGCLVIGLFIFLCYYRYSKK